MQQLTSMIREATALDAEAIARVQVRSWQSTYRGIIADAYLDGMDITVRRDRHLEWFARRPSSSFARVAVEGPGKVVGFAMAGQARNQAPQAVGEIYVLYLLADAQRKGVGTRLMRSMARGLEHHGMESMVIWVLERNPATRFYEQLGGLKTSARETSVGTQKLTEVAYFWDSLEPLLRAESPAV